MVGGGSVTSLVFFGTEGFPPERVFDEGSLFDPFFFYFFFSFPPPRFRLDAVFLPTNDFQSGLRFSPSAVFMTFFSFLPVGLPPLLSSDIALFGRRFFFQFAH